jgi:hypothetical protein
MGHHLCGSDGASERASASPAWRGFSGSESASPARISISGIAQLLQGGVSVSRVEPASPRRSRHLQSRARFSGMARLLHARVRFSGLEKLLQRGAASPGRSPLLQIRSGFSKLARLLHARVSFFGLDRLLQRGATSPQQGRPLQGRAGFSNLERLLHGIVSLSRAEPIAAAAIWLAPIPPSRKGDRSLTVKSRTFVPRRIMAPESLPSGSPRSFRPQRGGGDSREAASHAHPRLRLRRLQAHQEQAAFTLALDVEEISGSCRRKDHAPLGISSGHRHSGIVQPNPGERKFVRLTP